MNEKGLAVVTGATRGIGLAVSKGLAEDGYQIVLVARNYDKLIIAREELLESKKVMFEPIILCIDINDKDIGLKLREIADQYGPITVLVNCAAMFIDGSLNNSIEDYRKIIETNVIAQFGIIKAIVDLMEKDYKGYIFNIASRAGIYGFPGGGLYGSTKAALIGLSDSLYREYAPKGIRFTALCPGWVNTEMAKESGTPYLDEEMIQPDDLLRTIRYLLSLSSNVCIREIVIEMKKSII